MSFWTRLRSQLINIKAFRPFFPFCKTLSNALTFPLDYAGNGKSRPFPSIINFNVTTRCNFNCEFCFNKENKILPSEELALDEIKDFIRVSARRRPGFFLTGGEPFMRKDIFDILEEIKRHALPAGVVTNGALLDEEKIDRLIALGLDVAIISFHGTAQVHDSVVGIKDAYSKALRALNHFAARMPPPGPMVNYIVSEKSVPVMRDFLDEASSIKNIVVRLAHLNFLTEKEIAAQKALWKERFGDVPLEILAYSYDCSPELFEPVKEVLNDPKYRRVLTKPILSDSDFNNWYSNNFTLGTKCLFIWRSLFLNSDGTVYPCQFLYIPMGNIRREPLENIWNNELYRRFRVTLKGGLMPGCSRCCKI